MKLETSKKEGRVQARTRSATQMHHRHMSAWKHVDLSADLHLHELRCIIHFDSFALWALLLSKSKSVSQILPLLKGEH